MDKHDVAAYFNQMAPVWDDELVRDDKKINRILDCAGIAEGVSVLDVACGTGVLFPDYLARNVKSVTGIDLSPAMIDVAKVKYSDPRITLVAGDAEESSFPMLFDRCVIYNAFPHFPNPAGLIRSLSETLRPAGRLTVAHGMGRAQIDRHHNGRAGGVSIGLLSEDKLASLFAPYFDVDVVVSEEEIFIVSGVKK
jgi:demethylmenaquinone methyltransferase/2-methoxy-6-polyprenyl-1,4-benzoquinol methylase